MDRNQKSKIVYRCPLCFNSLVDVVLDEDAQGEYSCMKCGYTGDEEDIINKYNQYKQRYKLMEKRITMEEQIKM